MSGICKGCGHPKPLDSDGLITDHTGATYHQRVQAKWGPCPGTGKAPRKETSTKRPPMPRSREELVEALRDWASQYQSLDQLPSLVSVLGEAADLLDSLEERMLDRLLSEEPVEAAKAELRPRPGDYLRNHHVRKAFKAAFTALQNGTDVEEGTGGC